MSVGHVPEPPLSEEITAGQLDADARRDLRGLQKDTADSVARHLVAAGMLIDEDPDQALAHARFARRRASRIALVREAAGIAAYHAGEWAEALGELRAARRMGGGPGHLAVMADIERALGRPERALELTRSSEARGLGRADSIELAIVAAGARRDLGELDVAVVGLQIPELDPARREPWSPRLFYAYADNLLAAGREAEALQWFVHAADVDEDGTTDAGSRIAELTGEPLPDDDVEFDVEELEPEVSGASDDSGPDDDAGRVDGPAEQHEPAPGALDDGDPTDAAPTQVDPASPEDAAPVAGATPGGSAIESAAASEETGQPENTAALHDAEDGPALAEDVPDGPAGHQSGGTAGGAAPAGPTVKLPSAQSVAAESAADEPATVSRASGGSSVPGPVSDQPAAAEQVSHEPVVLDPPAGERATADQVSGESTTPESVSDRPTTAQPESDDSAVFDRPANGRRVAAEPESGESSTAEPASDESTSAEPGSAESDPAPDGSATVEPESVTADPDSEELDPETVTSEPGSAESDPASDGSASAEPESATAAPDSTESDPAPDGSSATEPVPDADRTPAAADGLTAARTVEEEPDR